MRVHEATTPNICRYEWDMVMRNYMGKKSTGSLIDAMVKDVEILINKFIDRGFISSQNPYRVEVFVDAIGRAHFEVHNAELSAQLTHLLQEEITKGPRP